MYYIFSWSLQWAQYSWPTSSRYPQLPISLRQPWILLTSWRFLIKNWHLILCQPHFGNHYLHFAHVTDSWDILAKKVANNLNHILICLYRRNFEKPVPNQSHFFPAEFHLNTLLQGNWASAHRAYVNTAGPSPEGQTPPRTFFAPTGKMCWISFKTIGHS